MRQFYLTYRIAKSPISQSLSWTHYIRLMRISDPDERSFYEIEAAEKAASLGISLNEFIFRAIRSAM